MKNFIDLRDDLLVIRFGYSEACFTAIKKFSLANYDKHLKHWTLPVESLPELLAINAFAPNQFQYRFTMEQAQNAIDIKLSKVQEAREKVATNPFNVSQEDIKLAKPEVTISLCKRGETLEVSIGASQVARKIIGKFEGSYYKRASRGYYLSVLDLVSFLKELRNNNISFAVLENCASRLKVGAEFRESIRSGRVLNATDFEMSLVGPFFYYDAAKHKFGVKLITSELLKIIFPKISSPAVRLRKSQNLTLEEVLMAIHQSRLQSCNFWISLELKELFDNLTDHFVQEMDSLPGSVSDPLFFITKSDGALLYDEKIGVAYIYRSPVRITSEGHQEQSRGNFVGYDDYFYYPISDIVEEVDPGVIILKSYEIYSKEIERRKNSLKTRNYYLDQKDWPPFMADEQLEKRMFPHQRVAAHWICNQNYGLLGDDMGLGKTLTVLAAFQELIAQNEVDLLVVVCPNSLVRNWVRESREWTPKNSILDLPSGKKNREDFLSSFVKDPSAKGLAVNYEVFRLPYVSQHFLELAHQNRILLCIDESQRVKNHQSKIFVALKEISQLSRRRVLLSGTPTPKDITDIWAQMYLVDLGARFGESYYKWLETVAELGTKWSDYAVKSFYPLEVEKTISRTHEVLLRRTKEQVVKLPEKLFSVRDIELEGDQLARYESVRKELLVQLRTTQGEIFVRELDNILEQYLRAVQIASNPRILDPEWEGVPAKFKELDAIVEELVRDHNRKLVVWTNYVHNVEELAERYKDCGTHKFYGQTPKNDRDRIIADFQSNSAKSARILIAVPAAGGVGITLTSAQTAVYLDKTWNAEHWMQSIDRVHRIGQNGVVNIISLHASGVDEFISYSLYKKQKEQAEVLGDSNISLKFSKPSRAELLAAVS